MHRSAECNGVPGMEETTPKKTNHAAFTSTSIHREDSLGLLFVSILGMVLDTVDILVALFAPRHRTGKGLILRGTSTAHHPAQLKRL